MYFSLRMRDFVIMAISLELLDLPWLLGGRDDYHGVPPHLLQVLHRQAPGGLKHLSRVRGRHSPVTSTKLHCIRQNNAGKV